MSRLPLSAALMTIAVLATAPGAAAKEITAMKICGARSLRARGALDRPAPPRHGRAGRSRHQHGRGPRLLLPGDRNDRRANRRLRGPLRAGLCPSPPGRAPAGRLPAGRVDAALGRGREAPRPAHPAYRAATGQAPPRRPAPARPFRRESGSHGRRPTPRTTGVCRRSSPACPLCWSSGSGSWARCSDGAPEHESSIHTSAPPSGRFTLGRGRHGPRRWPPRSRGPSPAPPPVRASSARVSVSNAPPRRRRAGSPGPAVAHVHSTWPSAPRPPCGSLRARDGARRRACSRGPAPRVADPPRGEGRASDASPRANDPPRRAGRRSAPRPLRAGSPRRSWSPERQPPAVGARDHQQQTVVGAEQRAERSDVPRNTIDRAQRQTRRARRACRRTRAGSPREYTSKASSCSSEY